MIAPKTGEFFRFPATTSAPKPVQKDGLPIWIAARDINSHTFGVDNGFNIQVTPLWQGLEEITDLMGKFNTACAAFDGPRPKIMLLHHTYRAADRDDTAQAAQELSLFYNNFAAWFQNERPVTQGLIDPLSGADMSANKMMSPDNMLRDLTKGTTQQVIDRIKRYEDLGYDEYAFWTDSGI